jgi:hypothetical protein
VIGRESDVIGRESDVIGRESDVIRTHVDSMRFPRGRILMSAYVRTKTHYK